MVMNLLYMEFVIGLFLSVGVLVQSSPMNVRNGNVTHCDSGTVLNRNSFPRGFVFGTASSAYQYEGAAKEGGRGPSIWDTFTHNFPERITDGSNGDVAVDSYHRYKEDVGIMKDLGLDAYRFSISWSRILPNGKVSGGVNKEGVRYYNNLINQLLSKGIKPYVTIFHSDLPQALQDEYGGFLSRRIVNDFKDYAEVCYREFGDRVKFWITLNEPSVFSNVGYAIGVLASGRCSKSVGNCTDSGVDPYLVSHNQLLAHAAAVDLYKKKYQAIEKGKIGITLAVTWIVPYSNSKSDKEAAQRAIDFSYGWFMDPLAFGNYPQSMRSLVGNRLPKFTHNESMMIKGSFDFLGLNYYTASYAVNVASSNTSNINPSYATDALVNQTKERKGIPIGLKSGAAWLYIYPQGIRDLLLYTKRKYNNIIIYITENGVAELDDDRLSLEESLEDHIRIDYHNSHLFNLRKAIKEGVDVRGYFAWSLLDNFEWNSGYTVRFGINYVDYKNGLKRYPKHSATWFKNFLQK